VKVLKAIEEKSVRRVGGLRAKAFNARIVAATNRNLEAAIAEGAFRPDLYYRIKALTLELPPLRSRGSDIPLLARHFLDRLTRQYGLPAKRLTPEAEAVLLAYSWPGNVRELTHLVERAILSTGSTIAVTSGLPPAQPRPRSTSIGCVRGFFVGVSVDEANAAHPEAPGIGLESARAASTSPRTPLSNGKDQLRPLA
jgi:transcriptional regulator with PAS, ATPase and Fis domain